MKQIKRLKITETRRRTLRVAAAPTPATCPTCHRVVTTISTAEAALALETTEAALACSIALGHIHAIPVAGGGVRICQESLLLDRLGPTGGSNEPF